MSTGTPTGFAGKGALPGCSAAISKLAEEVVRARRTYNSEVEKQAYLLAKRRHFAPGHELDDWVAAEALLAANAKIHS